MKTYSPVMSICVKNINITQVCIQIEGQISKYGMPHMQMA